MHAGSLQPVVRFFAHQVGWLCNLLGVSVSKEDNKHCNANHVFSKENPTKCNGVCSLVSIFRTAAMDTGTCSFQEHNHPAEEFTMGGEKSIPAH